MKSWKINRRISNTEAEVLCILARSADLYIDNTHIVTRDKNMLVSMQSNGDFGFWQGMQLDYDETISYEQAIKYLEKLVKERKI